MFLGVVSLVVCFRELSVVMFLGAVSVVMCFRGLSTVIRFRARNATLRRRKLPQIDLIHATGCKHPRLRLSLYQSRHKGMFKYVVV
jgi:hypothetical protein